MKALLPVAGSGTRMYPLGVTTPKALIPILNKPLIEWSLEALDQAGVDEVIVVISAGTFGKKIRDYVTTHLIDTKKYKLKITYAVQEQQLGTAHVVQMAKDLLQPEEEFIFMYGDDLYGPETVKQVVDHQGLAVTGKKVSDPEKWGIFQTDEQHNLTKVVEKPEEFVGDLANIGCMKLPYRIFEIFDQLKVSKRGEYELTDSLQILAHEQPVAVLETLDYWIPIGYPWHILEAAEFFLPKIETDIAGEVEDNVTIHGQVILPKSSIIRAGTYVDGNVMFGEHCIIGPGAYFRKNVVIGDHSRIGYSVQVKNSVIGHHCKLDHHLYVGDSVIGNYVKIGGSSSIANLRHDQVNVKSAIKGQLVDTGRRKFGAVIGDEVKLGINTLVYPGRKIWPGLATRPGTIVDKDLTE